MRRRSTCRSPPTSACAPSTTPARAGRRHRSSEGAAPRRVRRHAAGHRRGRPARHRVVDVRDVGGHRRRPGPGRRPRRAALRLRPGELRADIVADPLVPVDGGLAVRRPSPTRPAGALRGDDRNAASGGGSSRALQVGGVAGAGQGHDVGVAADGRGHLLGQRGNLASSSPDGHSTGIPRSPRRSQRRSCAPVPSRRRAPATRRRSWPGGRQVVGVGVSGGEHGWASQRRGRPRSERSIPRPALVGRLRAARSPARPAPARRPPGPASTSSGRSRARRRHRRPPSE